MENKNPNGLDYEVMKQMLKEQFRTGKSLFSKGGADTASFKLKPNYSLTQFILQTR